MERKKMRCHIMDNFRKRLESEVRKTQDEQRLAEEFHEQHFNEERYRSLIKKIFSVAQEVAAATKLTVHYIEGESQGGFEIVVAIIDPARENKWGYVRKSGFFKTKYYLTVCYISITPKMIFLPDGCGPDLIRNFYRKNQDPDYQTPEKSPEYLINSDEAICTSVRKAFQKIIIDHAKRYPDIL